MTIEVRQAVSADLRYVVSLMRANRESVGGLPVPAVEERIGRGTVLLALVDDDPVGYLLYDLRGGVLRIPQACIQYDARRRRYGVALIQRLLQRHADVLREVSLRCAADLEANVFWRDMGFTCTASVPGGKRRGRTINLWTLWFERRLVALPDLAVPPAAEVRQDSMYDDSGFLLSSPSGFKRVVELPKLAWSNRKPVERDEQLRWEDNLVRRLAGVPLVRECRHGDEPGPYCTQCGGAVVAGLA